MQTVTNASYPAVFELYPVINAYYPEVVISYPVVNKNPEKKSS